jgi:hypothetical protein
MVTMKGVWEKGAGPSCRKQDFIGEAKHNPSMCVCVCVCVGGGGGADKVGKD